MRGYCPNCDGLTWRQTDGWWCSFCEEFWSDEELSDYDEVIHVYDDYDYIEVCSDLSIRELLTTRRYPVAERLRVLRSKVVYRVKYWLINRCSKLIDIWYTRILRTENPYDIPF